MGLMFFTDLHQRCFCTDTYFFLLLSVFVTVLKRGKAKKGKNDLISAEDGEDPFADISSVGMSYIFLFATRSRSPSYSTFTT